MKLRRLCRFSLKHFIARHQFASYYSIVLLLALSALVWNAPCLAATPVVTAYIFPAGKLLTADQIEAGKITRVNYAFANINHDQMVEGDPSDASNFAVLNSLKKTNPKLTVLVSVGGWSWSGNFSDMALTRDARATFIDSVAAFITRYNLDGLDIDWEYPGLEGSTKNFRPADKRNYTLLVEELRSRFDTMQRATNKHLYLTLATGGSSEFLEHTEMAKVQKYVDTVNLMAYDYYEPPEDRITGNHAPLFNDPADPKAISADRTIQEYEKAGVPAAKLVLGVPFYGHVWGQVPSLNNGLFQSGRSVPNAFSGYSAITNMISTGGYSRYWDKAASVPYLYNSTKQIFVSYEDPESLSLKCKYVLAHHLAGIMFWDYSSDPTGALLDAIDNGLQPSVKSSSKQTGRQ